MTSRATSGLRLSKFEKRPKMLPPTALGRILCGTAFCLSQQLMGFLLIFAHHVKTFLSGSGPVERISTPTMLLLRTTKLLIGAVGCLAQKSNTSGVYLKFCGIGSSATVLRVEPSPNQLMEFLVFLFLFKRFLLSAPYDPTAGPPTHSMLSSRPLSL